MTVSFSPSAVAQTHDPVAFVTAGQLAVFRSFLGQESARLGQPLLDLKSIDTEPLNTGFEARVCPLSLVSVARLFDLDPAVIGVIEEAQFRGLRVLVKQDQTSGAVTLRLSPNQDTPGRLLRDTQAAVPLRV